MVTETEIWKLLDNVMDPEVPVLSVNDLGIVRSVEMNGDAVKLVVTPTYSGCPAMDTIRTRLRMELLAAGFREVDIETVLSPVWTTEWMSTAGKEKLQAYGIAPPNAVQQVCMPDYFRQEEAVACPHCGSWSTVRVSEFGSTACKAHYRCNHCLEPFDYFKCH